MTYLEIIQLVKNSTPTELSLEQADVIRAKLQESPELSSALGSPEWVEEYLAALPVAGDEPSTAMQQDEEVAVMLEADSRVANVATTLMRRGWLLAGCLVLFLGGAFWIYSIQTPPEENAVVDAEGDDDSGAEQTNDEEKSTDTEDRSEKSNGSGTTEREKDEKLWKGWTFTGDKGAEHIVVSDWDLTQPDHPIATMCLVTGRQRVVLSKEHELSGSERWLSMQFKHLTRSPQSGTVEVRANGQPIAKYDFPMFGDGAVFAIPLTGLEGRTKFEVVIQPGDENERISWWAIRFAESVKSPGKDVVLVPRLRDPTASIVPSTIVPSTEDDPDLDNVVQLIPSPHVMFEDEGVFVASETSATGSATLVKEHVYTGVAAIRVSPTGSFRRVFPQKMVITENPGPGEFRYLRFAVRVSGGGRTALALDHTNAAKLPVAYDLGEGDPAIAKAYRIQVASPQDGWVVVTRDLFRDFGKLELTGLMLSKLDGGHVLFDHVYIARSLSHFDRVVQPAEPNLAKHVAPPIPAGPKSEDLAQTVVAIHLDNRVATGVIVSEDGFVFTTAEMAIHPAKKIVVYLSDGTHATGKLIATRRDFNVALLKLSGLPRYYPFAKMAKASNFGASRDYRGFSHYKSHKPGAAAEEIFNPRSKPFFGYSKVGNVQFEFAVGGPVFDPQGQLIGIHIGSERGAMRYREIEYFTMYWDQLTAGQSGG
jgi:S1-C subfamily serine protease